MICGDAQHPINLSIKHHMSYHIQLHIETSSACCRIQATPGCRGVASRRFSSLRLFTELSGSRTWQRPVEISRNATGKDLDTLSIIPTREKEEYMGNFLRKLVFTWKKHLFGRTTRKLSSWQVYIQLGFKNIISTRSACGSIYCSSYRTSLAIEMRRFCQSLKDHNLWRLWRIQALVPTSQWIRKISKIGILWLLEVLNVYISKSIFCNYPTKL